MRRNGWTPLQLALLFKNHTEVAKVLLQHVRCRQSFGIHWGTWPLTDEPMDEPVTLLQQKVAEAGLPPPSFVALRHGAAGVCGGCQGL